MDAVWAAVAVALISSVVAPTILHVLANRTRREDWARQDAVAARVAEAARAAQGVAARVEEVAVEARSAQADNAARLERIHKDVNSNLTAAMEAQLEATRAQLVLMEREERKDTGEFKPRLAREVIDAVRAKVASLEASVADRRSAQVGGTQELTRAVAKATTATTDATEATQALTEATQALTEGRSPPA